MLLRCSDRYCFCGFLILIFFTALFQIVSPDLFWHLPIGKWMVEHMKLFQGNVFSWTNPQHLWIPTYPFFQVMVYSFYSFSGMGGLVLLRAGIITLTWGSLYLSFLRRLGTVITLLCLLFFYDLCFFRNLLRPHLVSFFFFSCVYLFLSNYRSLNWKRDCLFSAVVFYSWSSFHSGVIFGLIFLFLFLLDEIYQGIRKGKWLSNSGLPILLSSSLFSILSPVGRVWPKYVWDHLFIKSFIELEEFRLLTFSSFPKHFVCALIIVFLTHGFLLWRGKHRLSFICLSVFASALLTKGIRFYPWFIFFHLPLVVASFQGVAFNIPTFNRWNEKCRNKRVNLMLILISLLLLYYGKSTVIDHFQKESSLFRLGLGIRQEIFPIKAMEVVEKFAPKRIYNSFSLGGFILYKSKENIKVFQDGRIHAYPTSFFKKQNQAKRSLFAWKSYLKGLGIDLCIFDKREEPPYLFYEFSSWGERLFEDDCFIVIKVL